MYIYLSTFYKKKKRGNCFSEVSPFDVNKTEILGNHRRRYHHQTDISLTTTYTHYMACIYEALRLCIWSLERGNLLLLSDIENEEKPRAEILYCYDDDDRRAFFFFKTGSSKMLDLQTLYIDDSSSFFCCFYISRKNNNHVFVYT